MKKTIRYVSLFAVILIALIIVPLFASCSDGAGNYAEDMDTVLTPEKGESSGGVSYAPNSSSSGDTSEGSTTRKIIRTFTILGETKEYDKTIDEVYNSISAHNGYISESKVTGVSYNSSSKYSREAYFVIKIPAEKLDGFVSQVGDLLNVTSSASTQDDVSEAYYSAEARMKTLETERESLLAMMDSLNTSTDYDFWYTLQKQISEIEQQIAEYQAILKSYDDKITYSTVKLTVRDVVEYTPAEEKDPTFFSRISKAFVESWNDFGEFCMDFAVVIVYMMPALLALVIIPGLIILFSVKAAIKKNKNKKQ